MVQKLITSEVTVHADNNFSNSICMNNICKYGSKYWCARIFYGVGLKVFSIPDNDHNQAETLEHTKSYASLTETYQELSRGWGNDLYFVGIGHDSGDNQIIIWTYTTDGGSTWTDVSVIPPSGSYKYVQSVDIWRFNDDSTFVGTTRKTALPSTFKFEIYNIAGTLITDVTISAIHTVYPGWFDTVSDLYYFIYQNTGGDLILASFNKTVIATVETLSITAPATFSIYQQMYWKQGGVECIIDQDHLYQRAPNQTTWQSTTATGTTASGIVWDYDANGEYIINYLIWNNKLYKYFVSGGLVIIGTWALSARVGFDNWFNCPVEDKIYELIPTSISDLIQCKVRSYLQNNSECSYVCNVTPISNEYLILYDDNDNEIFEGWWYRPQYDGDVYRSDLRSPASMDLDAKVDENWSSTTETVIIKDIIDTYCYFISYSSTSISGSGTSINFNGKGLTVRECLNRLAIQDLRCWYIKPDLTLYFNLHTTVSGKYAIVGPTDTYKYHSQTLAWLLTWTEDFDTYEQADDIGGHNEVLKIIEDTANKNAYIDISSTDDIWISMWVRAVQTDKKFIFLQTMTAAGAATNDLVYFATDGKIYYEDGAAATDDLGAYVADTWYHFAFHFVKNTAIVVYRDGTLVSTTKSTADASTVRLQMKHITAASGTFYIDAYYYGTSEYSAKLGYYLPNGISMNRDPIQEQLKYSRVEAYGSVVGGTRIFAERFGEAGYNGVKLYAGHLTTTTALSSWLDNFLTKNNATVKMFDIDIGDIGMLQVGETILFDWSESPWNVDLSTVYIKEVMYDALADGNDSVILHNVFYFKEDQNQGDDNAQIIEQIAGDYIARDGSNTFTGSQMVATDKKIQFRDTAIYISSKTDGHFDIDADTSIDLNTPLLDISNQALGISLKDNEAAALDITEGANSYLKFVTTNGSEKVVAGKDFQAPNIIGQVGTAAVGAGKVGEVISSYQSATNATYNAYSDLTSITLTDGIWMIKVGMRVASNGASFSACDFGLGFTTTSGNSSTGLKPPINWLDPNGCFSTSFVVWDVCLTDMVRVNGSTSTIYLSDGTALAAGLVLYAKGYIGARTAGTPLQTSYIMAVRIA